MLIYDGVKRLGLLPQALRISSPHITKNIPLKLHTGRAPAGGIEAVQAIIEGAAHNIDWKLTTAVTFLQIRTVAEHIREGLLTSKVCRLVDSR